MGLPTGIITAARDLKKESDEYKADSKTEI
jgi:hypothetical protein